MIGNLRLSAPSRAAGTFWLRRGVVALRVAALCAAFPAAAQAQTGAPAGFGKCESTCGRRVECDYESRFSFPAQDPVLFKEDDFGNFNEVDRNPTSLFSPEPDTDDGEMLTFRMCLASGAAFIKCTADIQIVFNEIDQCRRPPVQPPPPDPCVKHPTFPGCEHQM